MSDGDKLCVTFHDGEGDEIRIVENVRGEMFIEGEGQPRRKLLARSMDKVIAAIHKLTLVASDASIDHNARRVQ